MPNHPKYLEQHGYENLTDPIWWSVSVCVCVNGNATTGQPVYLLATGQNTRCTAPGGTAGVLTPLMTKNSRQQPVYDS